MTVRIRPTKPCPQCDKPLTLMPHIAIETERQGWRHRHSLKKLRADAGDNGNYKGNLCHYAEPEGLAEWNARKGETR